ncbi:MAG: P-type conjugative transfer protein TrbJ [Acidiferrobacterales bacterium]
MSTLQACKRIRRACALAFVGAVSFSAVPTAMAGTFTGGATFFEQIVQEMTAVEQYAKQVMEVEAQLSMVRNQVLNLTGLPGQYWQTIAAPVNQLVALTAQAQGVGYAAQNIPAEFTAAYPGATTTVSRFTPQFQQWSTDTNAQVRTAIATAGLESTQFASEQDALQAVQAASRSATGRMQVLQAGNQIAGIMANKLQALQQLMMSENDAQNAYMAQHTEERQQQQNALKAWRDSNRTLDDNGT